MLLVGLIPEAQEAMQVPNRDIRAGAGVNILRAMRWPKDHHTGAQEKESEERRGHIDVQPSEGEDLGLRMRISLLSLSDKLNAF